MPDKPLYYVCCLKKEEKNSWGPTFKLWRGGWGWGEGFWVSLLNLSEFRVELLNFKVGPDSQASEVPSSGDLISFLHHALLNYGS